MESQLIFHEPAIDPWPPAVPYPDRTCMRRTRELGDLGDPALCAHLLSKKVADLTNDDIELPFDRLVLQVLPKRRDMLQMIARQGAPTDPNDAAESWIPYNVPDALALLAFTESTDQLRVFVRDIWRELTNHENTRPPHRPENKFYDLSHAEARKHKPKHPNATGINPSKDDTRVLFQVWSTQRTRDEDTRKTLQVAERWLPWSREEVVLVIQESKKRLAAIDDTQNENAILAQIFGQLGD